MMKHLSLWPLLLYWKLNDGYNSKEENKSAKWGRFHPYSLEDKDLGMLAIANL